MNVDIFIRSYRQDFGWLKYCVKSIEKYAKGFGKLHICIPVDDFEFLPNIKAEVHLVEPWADDYIGQQNDKLYADFYCRSPHILILDSDCVFTQEVKPDDFFIGGKPIWLYESIPREASPWWGIIKETIGCDAEYDFMRRHPFVFSSQSLKDFRRFFFNCHKEGITTWLKRRPYRSFTEFNAFGAWAYHHYYDHFAWLPPQEMPVYVNQKWSWGGLSEEIRAELENLLA